MTDPLIPHAAVFSSTALPVPVVLAGVAPRDVNQAWDVNSVRLVYTTCAVVGARQVVLRVLDDNFVEVQRVSFVPTQAANLVYTYQTYRHSHLSATVANLTAYAPFERMLLPFGYQLLPYDNAAIAANWELGIATDSSSTTLTDSTATWTDDQWIGYIVQVGNTVQAYVTDNTATVLTVSSWSQLVAAVAESSTALSMTDDDAAWATDEWVGYTVAMGGSTATITGNNTTTLLITGWYPLAPADGAYKIYGAYSIFGDITMMSVSYNDLRSV